MILSHTFLHSFYDAGQIGGAKNMTKPTRKRYSFAPIYKSTLKRLFEQISVPTTDQIFLIFFIGKRKNIFRASSKRSPKKRVKFILRSCFRRASRLCFFAAFIMKLGQPLTPHNLCIPSLCLFIW